MSGLKAMSGLNSLSRFKNYWDRRRAAGDVARLFSGELSAKDEARLSGWRNASREYQSSLVGTAHILSDLEKLVDDPELLALVAEPPQGNQSASEQSGWGLWPKLAIAATLLLAVSVGLLTLYMAPVEKHSVLLYVTRTGEQKTISLQDGSVITLNTATQLLVDITETTRRVVLERGEAYFTISADPHRPFNVDIGSRMVSVLGTEFNILRSPEKFTLAVVQGMVSILREGESASASAPALTPPLGRVVKISAPGQHRLQAGMVAEFDVGKQELTAYRAQDINSLHRWRKGLISFNADPLSRVVHELNRYSTRKILIEDADIMDLQIYATARVNDVESVLVGLEQSLPIKVVSYVDRIVIVKRDD